MPSLRFGLMSLLLLAAIWRFTRGGPWMWAPLLVSSSLVALADAYGPDETTDLSTTATRALNLWLLLTLPLLAAMHTVLWWMAGVLPGIDLPGRLDLRVGQALAPSPPGHDLARRGRHHRGPRAGASHPPAPPPRLGPLAARPDLRRELRHRACPRPPREGLHLRGSRLGPAGRGRLRLHPPLHLGPAVQRLAHRGRAPRPEGCAHLEPPQPLSARLGLHRWLDGPRLPPRRLAGRGLLRGRGPLGQGRPRDHQLHRALRPGPGARHQRHSDHHAEGGKPFWRLRPRPEAPMLPAGYMAMLIVALAPPWFRRVMQPRLAAWDAQHADATERQVALEENLRAGWTGA